jgi:hypothetical protein
MHSGDAYHRFVAEDYLTSNLEDVAMVSFCVKPAGSADITPPGCQAISAGARPALVFSGDWSGHAYDATV